MSRLIRIRWTGFAHTRHWLKGTALASYVIREHYVEHVRESLNHPSPLFPHLLADHAVSAHDTDHPLDL